MNELNAKQASTSGAATTGILNRLRRLVSPASLINAQTAAMAAEPAGAVEAAEIWRVGQGLDWFGEDPAIAVEGERESAAAEEPSRSERLLRSACDLLCNQPLTLISATSVSLPQEPGLTTSQLIHIASQMAIEYGVLADVSINGDHVRVRLTRRHPPVPAGRRGHENQTSDSAVGRGSREGIN